MGAPAGQSPCGAPNAVAQVPIAAVNPVAVQGHCAVPVPNVGVAIRVEAPVHSEAPVHFSLVARPYAQAIHYAHAEHSVRVLLDVPQWQVVRVFPSSRDGPSRFLRAV